MDLYHKQKSQCPDMRSSKKNHILQKHNYLVTDFGNNILKIVWIFEKIWMSEWRKNKGKKEFKIALELQMNIKKIVYFYKKWQFNFTYIVYTYAISLLNLY